MQPTRLSLKGNSVYLIVQGFPRTQTDGRVKHLRLRMSTGVTIDPGFWNEEMGSPTTAFSMVDGFALDQKLRQLNAKMSVAWAKAREEGSHHPERVREIFEELNGVVRQAAPVVVVDQKLIDVIKELEQGSESPLTAQTYHAFAAMLTEADKKIKMSGLTDAWRDRFYDRVSVRKTENTMWKVQKTINRAINFSKKKKMKVGIDTDSRYRLTTPDTDYLDWQDIARVVKYVPKTKAPESARRLNEICTLMLTMLFTSCRISDVWNCLESIQERNGILAASFRTKKKCGRVHPLVGPVILLPLAQRLAKHGVPKRRADQDINRGIKEILAEMKIRKDQSCHSMRRAFITNWIGLGSFSESLLAKVFTSHSLSGELKVMAGYDQADITAKQRQFLKILSTVSPKDTGGLKLM